MIKRMQAEDIPFEYPLWIRGELLLGREIIFKAFEDIAKGYRATADEADALGWVTSKSCEPFSFLWWCDYLRLNGDYLAEKAKGIADEREKRVKDSKRACQRGKYIKEGRERVGVRAFLNGRKASKSEWWD